MDAFSRRAVLIGSLAAASCGRATDTPKQKAEADTGVPQDDVRFAAIEKRIGGRLGVAALNTADGAMLTHWANERFAMCSSFKWLLAAAVLRAEQEGRLQADAHIAYTAHDLPANSPRTQEHLARGWMSVDDLCAAAIEVSDNGAANLLLNQIEGPTGFTRFARSTGDSVTRLDRTETSLNENAPGDPRDTTMPDAMIQTMKTVLVGDVLKPQSRDRLIRWLKDCATGMKRLRAGLPRDWVAGDKTGTGFSGPCNDNCIAWPPGRAPILMVVYVDARGATDEQREAPHARIAGLIAKAFAG